MRRMLATFTILGGLSLASTSAWAWPAIDCETEEDCEGGMFCADCDGDGVYHCSEFSCQDCPEAPCPEDAPYCADCDGDGTPHCSADPCGCTEPPPPSQDCVDVPGIRLSWVAPGSDWWCKAGLVLSGGIVGYGQLQVEAVGTFSDCAPNPGGACLSSGSLTGSGTVRVDVCGPGATATISGSSSFQEHQCEVCLEPPTYSCVGLDCLTANASAMGRGTADANFVIPVNFFDVIGGRLALRASGGANVTLAEDISQRGTCGTCPNCTQERKGAGPSAALVGELTGFLGPFRVQGAAGGNYDGTISWVEGSGECAGSCVEASNTASTWIEARVGGGIPGIGLGGMITVWRYECSGTWAENTCTGAPPPSSPWTCRHRWMWPL